MVELADGLESFPWSSLSYYRLPPSRRQRRQIASDGLEAFAQRDTAAGRRKFLEGLEERAALSKAEEAGLIEIEGQGLQSTLRRGWYFGSRSFGENMLGLAEEVLRNKAGNLNYQGAELREHGEKRAEEIVMKGLRITGLKETELHVTAKSDWRKAMIALAVKTETGMSLKWIAERLKMGVTTGISRYANQARHELEHRRRKAKIFRKIIE